MFNGLTTEEELSHEESCVREGVDLYQRRQTKHEQAHSESLTKPGKRVLSRAIDPLAEEIRTFMDRASKGAGRKHLSVKYLKLVEAEVVAFITVNCAVNHLTSGVAYQTVASEVGRRLEDEIRFRTFEEQNRGWWKVVNNNLKQNPDGYQTRVRRNSMIHAMNKLGMVWEKWTKETHFHVGSKLLELFIDACGLFEIVKESRGRRDSRIYLRPTDSMLEWIGKFNSQSEVLCPRLQPMLCPPKPWTGIDDGGYFHALLKTAFVKSASRGYKQELRVADMPEVYKAVNNLQSVAWKIHPRVLEVAKAIYNSDVPVEGVPTLADTQWVSPGEEPEITGDPATKLAWSEWKYRVVEKRKFQARAKAKRSQAYALLELADKFSPREAVWFPVRLDFRSRMYYIPQYLNPQGSDLAKGLLLFAEGKPLGSEGLRWLSIHVANCFGYDKVNMFERRKWTGSHEKEIAAVVADPMANLWWTEADKPWQFLAACFEYVGANEQGPEYVSHLPVLVDGSCNGLQHFSAMLRDEVCGRYVNLTVNDKPGDIYAEVAKVVEGALRTDTSATGTFPPSNTKNTVLISTLAQQWLDYGITRSLAKRPVMVLPYGGTQSAVTKYIEQYCIEEGHPFGKTLKRACSYLGVVFWQCMKQVVVKPMEAMDWLRKASRKASATGQAVWWTTPTKFIVCQMYKDISRRRVQTKIGQQAIRMEFTLAEETDKLDKKRQATAISPNFVHSLDASALMLTVNAMNDRGITSFAAVHDSYGTHACDMEILSKELREVFYVMYSERDVLADFSKEVESMHLKEPLDALPSKGSLELSEVLRSAFFFA